MHACTVVSIRMFWPVKMPLYSMVARMIAFVASQAKSS